MGPIAKELAPRTWVSGSYAQELDPMVMVRIKPLRAGLKTYEWTLESCPRSWDLGLNPIPQGVLNICLLWRGGPRLVTYRNHSKTIFGQFL